MRTGEYLNLTDGKGNLFTASIVTADKKQCEVKIVTVSSLPPVTRKVSIAISLIKNASRFEWFLEKAAEIGVSEIIPLLCQRTERQHFRHDRMNNILISAMLQSQQTRLPVLHPPTAFESEENEKMAVRELIIEDTIQILIGPEGDFSSEEIQTALNNNYRPVTLGGTRLRTETAGIVAASLLMSL
jgi:16S rRNA (uracil1498-N3)-methyltransferase